MRRTLVSLRPDLGISGVVRRRFLPGGWLVVLLVALASVPSWGMPPGVARPKAGQPDSLLRLSPARRFSAIKWAYEMAMRNDTTAAQQLRRELEDFFKKNGTDQDRLRLDMAFLVIDRGREFHPERILPRGAALLRRAEAQRDTVMLAVGYLHIGEYFYLNRKAYYMAFRYFDRAFDFLQHLTDEQFDDRVEAIYLLAMTNYHFFDYPKAITLGRFIHPKARERVTYNHLFNAGLLGQAYLRLNRYDSARYYLDWGLRQLPVEGLYNEAWTGILNGVIGQVLLAQGQPDAALRRLTTGVDYALRTKVWGCVALYGAPAALLFLKKARLDSAGYYARLAHHAARRTGEPERLYETHQALRAYYERLGRPDLALRHADSSTAARDRWRAERDVTLKHRAEVAVAADRHQARELLLLREKERQELLRNGLILVFALGAAIAGLLYNRQAVAHRHRQEQAQAEQAQSEAELRQAQAQLDQYVQHIREKNDLIERISTELTQATRPDAFVPDERVPALLDSVILTDSDWQRFRHLFEQVHPRFFERLHDAHPDLTPAEIRLVALSKLALSPREMAPMLGISPGSVRKVRYRLRQKLEQAGADEALLALIGVV